MLAGGGFGIALAATCSAARDLAMTGAFWGETAALANDAVDDKEEEDEGND
jgi:hypothetical protein